MGFQITKIPRSSFKPIGFKNVAKDFENEFHLIGKTKSGRFRVREVIGSSQDYIDLGRGYIAKKVDKRQRIYTGGSPFNTYYRDD